MKSTRQRYMPRSLSKSDRTTRWTSASVTTSSRALVPNHDGDDHKRACGSGWTLESALQQHEREVWSVPHSLSCLKILKYTRTLYPYQYTGSPPSATASRYHRTSCGACWRTGPALEFVVVGGGVVEQGRKAVCPTAPHTSSSGAATGHRDLWWFWFGAPARNALPSAALCTVHQSQTGPLEICPRLSPPPSPLLSNRQPRWLAERRSGPACGSSSPSEVTGRYGRKPAQGSSTLCKRLRSEILGSNVLSQLKIVSSSVSFIFDQHWGPVASSGAIMVHKTRKNPAITIRGQVGVGRFPRDEQ